MLPDFASDPATYGETRYLLSKISVDDRALNRHVLETVRSALAPLPTARVLEIGAGVGTMLTRLVDWRVLRAGEYVALDVDARLLGDLHRWLQSWAVGTKRKVEVEGAAARIRADDGTTIDVLSTQAELQDFAGRPADAQGVDLLVANAVLDLVDVPAVLPTLLARLAPRGVFWFTINFDGESIFQPDHPADDALMAAFHRTMDERVRFGHRAGESRAGRHLFAQLQAAGARVLAAGSSDWVVFPSDGRYPDNEAFFLFHILRTIEEALEAHPEVDRATLDAWLRTRRAQVERGELTYVAHQLDFAGQRQAD
jgi:hypothetical protein